jgi:protein-disulfide isomerase
MLENKSQGLEGSNSPPPPRYEPLAVATLAGVVVMLAISLWNVWNLNRLGERVGKLETQLSGGTETGPDPNRIYTIRTDGAPTKGPDTAPVTIVEFSDFQCPFCAKVAPTLKQIEDTYQGRVRIVWKHLPLPFHKNAAVAAVAAEAARKQGKFWEFHDKLFANQDKLGPDELKQYAKDLRLDMTHFETDMQSVDEKKKIEAVVAEAGTLGLTGTPGIFVNGRFVLGAQPFETFAKIIDEELTKLRAPVPPKSSSN